MQHLRAPPGRYAVGVADHVGVSVGLDRITIHHLVIIIIIYGHSGSRSYTPAGAPWGVPRDGADRITHTHTSPIIALLSSSTVAIMLAIFVSSHF